MSSYRKRNRFEMFVDLKLCDKVFTVEFLQLSWPNLACKNHVYVDFSHIDIYFNIAHALV